MLRKRKRKPTKGIQIYKIILTRIGVFLFRLRSFNRKAKTNKQMPIILSNNVHCPYFRHSDTAHPPKNHANERTPIRQQKKNALFSSLPSGAVAPIDKSAMFAFRLAFVRLNCLATECYSDNVTVS